MRAVHFGAGNIGRGFIGPLLIESGHAVTFVDIDAERVRLLNDIGSYPVHVIGQETRTIWVRGFRAMSATNAAAVAEAIAEADIVTTAVGKAALAAIAPLIAHGLLLRLRMPKAAGGPVRLLVTACENIADNSAFLAGLVAAALPGEVWQEVQEFAVFPNCVVDRIVPNLQPGDLDHPLAAAVEEYSLFVVDATVLGGRLPELRGVEFSSAIQKVLEQKLFTLNMAHAVVGYYGYLAGFRYVHDALQDTRVRELLEGAFGEVYPLLRARHGVGRDEHQRYVQTTFRRLGNPKLRDEIIRVARQPRRKLHPTDRLVAPAKLALSYGTTPAYLATGVAGALAYDYAGDEEARMLSDAIQRRGITAVLAEVSAVSPREILSQLITSDYLFLQLARRP